MAPVPSWLPGRTWYHLHALRASGAPDVNPDATAGVPCGRALRRLVPWLDHVAGLGCGGILLTPVAVSATHGYDTVDPFRLDQRLGDDDDFDEFARACRDLDLRLVLDGVFNHVGRGFGAFREVLEQGAHAPSAGWFHLDFEHDDGDGFAYRTFEGHRGLVALNHRAPAVLDWATEVALHWLGRGADGWRFDVAYAVPRDFWAALASRVVDRHPEAFLFGEVIHGDYAGFVAESGLHSVTQYELHKALWSSCNDRNLFELAWALKRHASMTASFVPVTFAGNHDVTRILSMLADPGHLGAVLAVLFTLPGTPCVYYGDEFGARGVKVDRDHGDDAIRPSLDELCRDAPPDADDVTALYREFIAFRRERAWLTTARFEVTDVANERLRIEVSGDGGVLAVAIDLSPQATRRWTIEEHAS